MQLLLYFVTFGTAAVLFASAGGLVIYLFVKLIQVLTAPDDPFLHPPETSRTPAYPLENLKRAGQ
jgi:hypothetical protein